MNKWFVIALFLTGQACYAQSATIDWATTHQVIDGFGGADIYSTLTPMQQQFFFGTGSGDLGLSILRVASPNGNNFPGNCSSVSTSCAGSTAIIGDMQAAAANGARIYVSAYSPPAAYMTNGSSICAAGSGNGTLVSADYGLYAVWLTNFIKSLQTYDHVSVYAMSIQNEPNYCAPYDSSIWSASNFDTFIKSNLGPTFAIDGVSTLIFMPETGNYSGLNLYGSLCAMDPSCANYVGGVNWHDYDAIYSAPGKVSSAFYPSGWPSGKKYWETEASCFANAGPRGCEPTWTTSITDGLLWAAIIDDRMVNENANAWLYWWLVNASGDSDNQGLVCGTNACGKIGAVAQRAYVLGQYARFIRPGYYRIDATHMPQVGISVSAYQNASTGELVIVATNYTSSPITQTFNITNAPTFTSITPFLTSTTQQIQEQSEESITGKSFRYELPADSVTTFIGESVAIPPAPTNLQFVVN